MSPLGYARFMVYSLYVLLTVAAAVALAFLPESWHPIVRVGVVDVLATVAVFAASAAFSNASFYDLYWSWVPPFIAFFFMAVGATFVFLPDVFVFGHRAFIVLGLVSFWAVRLSWNWTVGWQGLRHEDWRYVSLRHKTGALYPLVNFSGIHLFPTILVFMGCLPLWYVGTSQRELGWLDAIAALVTFGAVLIEAVADAQKRAFQRESSSPQEVCERGLWSWSRHPNYLGEIGFWLGLFLFGLAADPTAWWTGVGAAAMLLLFVFISIPMLEKRQIERRAGYRDYTRRVGMLLPKLGA